MITFVGAGPGDPELITVKGANCLREADCIVYAGSLVNQELLKLAGEHCRIYNSASMTLDEVIHVMVEAERNGEKTVRLHTGDPSVFGAHREQMDALRMHGIEFEVVPGVSSFCGAAASLKAEYTLPSVSQTVILTRREGRTPVPRGQDIASLAAHGASMVLFLSVSMAQEVSRELIQGGYSASTPAAIVYKATWEDEKVIHTTVEGLPQAVKESGITKTALITVGDFLGDTYERSKLYDAAFETEFRKAKHEAD